MTKEKPWYFSFITLTFNIQYYDGIMFLGVDYK